MYDFAHPLEDAFEGITHSICTLEFESNRELYDWVLDRLGPWDPRPRQYEFARLALGYTVMSKRKLLQLVTEGRVSGWDDPRMPTVAGMRRRGVTPEALRDFAELIGVAKNNSRRRHRQARVRDPGRPRGPLAARPRGPRPDPARRDRLAGGEGRVARRALVAGRSGPRPRRARSPSAASCSSSARTSPSTRPRTGSGSRRGARCGSPEPTSSAATEVVRGPGGEVTELRCHPRPGVAPGPRGLAARPGDDPLGPRDRAPSPRRSGSTTGSSRSSSPTPSRDFLQALNPASLVVATGARVEPALAKAEPGSRWQFLRQGYFFVDPVESRPGAPVFNRTITLRDTWGARAAAKAEERRGREKKPAAPESPARAAEDARRVPRRGPGGEPRPREAVRASTRRSAASLPRRRTSSPATASPPTTSTPLSRRRRSPRRPPAGSSTTSPASPATASSPRSPSAAPGSAGSSRSSTPGR